MKDPDTAKVHIEGARRMLKSQAILRSLEFDTWASPILFWLV